jgi:hypothetical protein
MLKFALPVLRQGALPLFRKHQVTPERLLAEAEGWYALFAGFFCKKRDSLGAGARGRGMAEAKPLDFVLLQSKSEAFCVFHCEGGRLALHCATCCLWVGCKQRD